MGDEGAALVLHQCHAVTYEDLTKEPIRCPEPGQWQNAPNGKTYVVCGAHMTSFEGSWGRSITHLLPEGGE